MVFLTVIVSVAVQKVAEDSEFLYQYAICIVALKNLNKYVEPSLTWLSGQQPPQTETADASGQPRRALMLPAEGMPSLERIQSATKDMIEVARSVWGHFFGASSENLGLAIMPLTRAVHCTTGAGGDG